MFIDGDKVVKKLSSGIINYLTDASNKIAEGDKDSLNSAYWSMQMSCELAMKSLMQQNLGKIIKTHDLFMLYDGIPGCAQVFSRDNLAKLPNWKQAVNSRYGCEKSSSIFDVFSVYQEVLVIVSASTSALKRKFNIKNGRIFFNNYLTEEMFTNAKK